MRVSVSRPAPVPTPSLQKIKKHHFCTLTRHATQHRAAAAVSDRAKLAAIERPYLGDPRTRVSARKAVERAVVKIQQN